MKNRCWVLLVFMLTLVSIGVSAQIRVEGVVVDEASTPLIGVSVQTKDSNVGTITDVNGHFKLTLLSDNTDLTFSYIGYVTQKVSLSGKTYLKVVMKEDNEMLDEVVVVGYGTQKKTSLTGSVAQIDGTDLMKNPTGNLSAMLQGRIPGLVTKQSTGQPGRDNSALYIRGVGNGDGNVLVVVDGIVRSFPSINPDEIESITVLKDASAAAVYGFNGSGGVILITTKKGKVQKPTIDFTSSVSLSMNTAFPKFLDGKDFMYWYRKAQMLDGVPENGLRFTQEDIDRATYGDPLGVYVNTDWFDMLFGGVAPTYTNTLSLSGGDERFKYFMSLGAFNQQGVMKGTSYDRYNVRANIDGKVTKNFDISLGIALRQESTEEPSVNMKSIMQSTMLAHPYLPAETYTGMPVAGVNLLGNPSSNPLAYRDLNGNSRGTERRVESNITLKYNVPGIKGLSAKFTAAYDYQQKMTKSSLLPYKLAVFNQTTDYWSEINGGTQVDGEASVSQAYYDQYNYYLQSSLEYSRTFDKHKVGGLFVYEYGGVKYASMNAAKKGYPIDDILDLSWGDEVVPNSVTGIHNKSNQGGYVMRFNYEYDGKYLFEFAGRLDGTTYLPAKNRWTFFPSTSLGWRMSEEPFIKEKFDWIDNLKVRFSIGQLGSQNGLGYGISYLNMVSLSQNPVFLGGNTLYRYLSMGNIPNSNLKWQVTNNYNLGLDIMLWKGLLGLEFDMFYSITKNKIESQTGVYPPSLGGYYSSLVNTGKHENKGFEIVLTHKNSRNDFTYDIRGNLSWSRNKILSINENTNVPDYQRMVGKSMGLYLGFMSDGLFQSEEEIANSAIFGPTLPGDIKLVDINGDGKITLEQDRVPIGRSNIPELMYGLNFSAYYKGFDLNLFFQGAALFDVYLCGMYSDLGFVDDTFYTRTFYSDGNTPYYLVEGSWTPENTNAKYPRLSVESRVNGGKYSDWWVKNGTYLRLKSAQLGYTIPQRLVDKFGLEKIRAFISGSNLFTLCGLDYLDPEMPNVNQGYYPQQRVFEFGVNITF